MASSSLQRTLDRLRIVLAPELPDEVLLKKFISSSDEIAFATLVRRHGRIILSVARRVVGNPHDSEDVLQATFLVLAQKARQVASRDALVSWLYRVAYRISLKAKARNDRRRHREKQVDLMSHFPSPPQEGRDWETLLDEEINRLPEKYRLPIILCELEGRSRKEVEHHLQLAAGTLSSRLTRAKRMLADRLTRRGLVLAGGALWAVPQATGGVPATLVAATAQKAILVAAGEFGAISGSVSVLMKTGVKAMFIAKLKATVATLMVIASLGAVGLVYSGGDETPTGPAKPQSELEKLRKENELLRVNLRVTLEKIQVLGNELRASKGAGIEANNVRRMGTGAGPGFVPGQTAPPKTTEPYQPSLDNVRRIGTGTGPGNKSATPHLPLDGSDARPLDNRGRRGAGGYQDPTSQPLPDKAGSPSRSTTGALQLLGDARKDVGRPGPVKAMGPPAADKEHRIGNNTNRALEDLGRALNNLADPNAGHKDESLRRAVRTLEQLLSELRSLEGNRLEEPKKR
jgi:RNA polymerase sigma factor (sigma-70 family)